MAEEKKKYDQYIGVPFSGIEKHIPRVDIIGTREDECLAIAVGCFFAGKESLVFVQNSGLGNCFDILTSLLIPYGIKIDLLIDNRIEPEHHRVMGEHSVNLLKEIGYDTFRNC